MTRFPSRPGEFRSGKVAEKNAREAGEDTGSWRLALFTAATFTTFLSFYRPTLLPSARALTPSDKKHGQKQFEGMMAKEI